MSSNEEIGTLLRNIQEGLTKYSVNELNDAIIKALSYKNDKKVEIKYEKLQMGTSEYEEVNCSHPSPSVRISC